MEIKKASLGKLHELEPLEASRVEYSSKHFTWPTYKDSHQQPLSTLVPLH